jgi:hypothetical protein
MKKGMKRWCEYQNLSKLALLRFSRAKKTMRAKQRVMSQPVRKGPVVKLTWRKATKKCGIVLASTTALRICAAMWTTVKKTKDHAVALSATRDENLVFSFPSRKNERRRRGGTNGT